MLITVGARFDDRVAGNPPQFAPRARFIAQLDLDPAEINKVKPVQWSHVGQLPDTLRSLTRYGRTHGVQLQLDLWHAEVATLKQVRISHDPHGHFCRDVLGLLAQVYGGDVDAELEWAPSGAAESHLSKDCPCAGQRSGSFRRWAALNRESCVRRSIFRNRSRRPVKVSLRG
jgi:hypothetical protein